MPFRRPTPRERAFNALRETLYRWAPPMVVAVNEPNHYSIDTRHLRKSRRPLNFGSVRARKTYISFVVMPIYVNPALTESLSPALKERQQGKSCFNFKAPDERLFAELKILVRAGYEDYVRRGYI